MFGRVIVKISGEGLAGNRKPADDLRPADELRPADDRSPAGDLRPAGSPRPAGDGHFDDAAVEHIADQVIEIVSAGTEAALVVGGGNFWRGRDRKSGMDKVRADQIGMLGTVMNGLYLAEVFRMKGVCAHVMTPFAVNGFTEVYTRESALRHMRAHEVVIFAGGTGHPFFSTDSIVVLRACELNADAVLYGKSVDGVYDSDPSVCGSARKYRTVSYKTVVANNLEVADITAIALTQGQGIPSLVFELLAPRAIAIACENNDKIHSVLGGTVVGQEMEDEFYGK